MTRLLSLKLERLMRLENQKNRPSPKKKKKFFFFAGHLIKKNYIDVCEGLKREDKGGELWGRMEVEVGFVASSQQGVVKD